MSTARGMVYLVGAGPGDPGLITAHGLALLRRADVIIHDRLIPHELLVEARADAIVIDAGKAPGNHKLTQDEINQLIVEHAESGKSVVRLKGGDPLVFGRGYEEYLACRQAGIESEIVPGVSSAIAAPAAVGIPITFRGLARNFIVVTAQTGTSDGEESLDYDAMAKMDTIVVLMGRSMIRNLVSGLIAAGKSPATPAACIQEATTPRQLVVSGTLADICDRADAVGIAAPMVMVVGQVAQYAVMQGGFESFGIGERSEALPLAGLRVVVTGSQSLNRRLASMLSSRGASVIDCPLIRIRYTCDAVQRDRCFGMLPEFDWVVFASVHGVRGFVRAMRLSGRDLRLLGRAKIAAVGNATARALRRAGLNPDRVPTEQTASRLVSELRDDVRGRRVLLPCGNVSRDELPVGLSNAGAIIDRLVVYENTHVVTPKARIERLREGFDSIIFGSPSSVERFAALKIELDRAVVACIGPTTAEALQSIGRTPDIVPRDYSVEGVIEAMTEYFQLQKVVS
ncbi:MAG: uroporphyrinogen-III C-methyltransferase [Planctomycetia bacterium]|nr:uroporphyrinogen-III C-methyltransferase [Planctomycetia bacterium]MCC7314289.1 uroporphyrinogen-III C-methyltransferase [Planctomycetota bacterium]